MSHTNSTLPDAALHSDRAYWLCQCIGWGVYSSMRLYAAIILIPAPWPQIVAELLLLDGSGLLLTDLLRRYLRRHEWSALPVSRRWPRVLGASVLLALPLGVATRFTDVAALQDPGPLVTAASPPLVVNATLFGLHILNWTVVFVIWLTIYFVASGVRHRSLAQLRGSETARALQLAELRLLKSQLNPHFLFNSLNTVRSLIADDPARATRAVTHLANTLRYTLNAGGEELVTLTEELAIVRDYLALESMRFEDRLFVNYDIAPDTGAVKIPVMLLQTVVENAIKHGISELPEGGAINVAARLDDKLFVLTVENPRPTTPRTEPRGIGLRNADERLRLLFGAPASLELDLSAARLATTRIRIPQP